MIYRVAKSQRFTPHHDLGEGVLKARIQGHNVAEDLAVCQLIGVHPGIVCWRLSGSSGSRYPEGARLEAFSSTHLTPPQNLRVLDVGCAGYGLKKIENQIQAEKEGKGKEGKVKAGDTVGSGDVVVVIE